MKVKKYTTINYTKGMFGRAIHIPSTYIYAYIYVHTCMHIYIRTYIHAIYTSNKQTTQTNKQTNKQRNTHTHTYAHSDDLIFTLTLSCKLRQADDTNLNINPRAIVSLQIFLPLVHYF